MALPGHSFARHHLARHHIARHHIARLAATIAALALPAARAVAAPQPAPAPPPRPLPGWAANWGPEHSTPGTSLALVEIARHVARPGASVPYPDWIGRTVVRYRLRATGLDPHATYRLWIRPSFHQPIRTRYLVHVDAAGHVTTRDGTKLVFTIGDYHRGEPYGVGLAAVGGTVRAMAVAYPFPLRATDGPCRLTLEMLAPNGTMFAARATGLPPGASVETISRANGRTVRTRKTASDKGRLATILAPPALDPDDHASYAIDAKSCRVRVDYGIGPAALAPQ